MAFEKPVLEASSASTPVLEASSASAPVPEAPLVNQAPITVFQRPLSAEAGGARSLELRLTVEAFISVGKTIVTPCTAAEWDAPGKAQTMQVKAYVHLDPDSPYAVAPLVRREDEVKGRAELSLTLRSDAPLPDHVKFTFSEMDKETDTDVLLTEGSVPLAALLEAGRDGREAFRHEHNFDPIKVAFTVKGIDAEAAAFFRRMQSEGRIYRSVLNDSHEMVEALHEVDDRIQSLIKGRATVSSDNAGTSMLKSDSFIPGEHQMLLYPFLAVDQEGLCPPPVQYTAVLCACALHYQGIHPRTVLEKDAAGQYVYSDAALAQLMQVAVTMPTRTCDAVYVSDLAPTVAGQMDAPAGRAGTSLMAFHESESFELPWSGLNFPFVAREAHRALREHAPRAGEAVEAAFDRYLREDGGKLLKAGRRLVNDDCDGLARAALENMRGLEAAYLQFARPKKGKAGKPLGAQGFAPAHVDACARALRAEPYACFSQLTDGDLRDVAEVMLRAGANFHSGVFTGGLGVCTTLSPRFDPTQPLSNALGGHCIGLLALNTPEQARRGGLGRDTQFIVCEATNSITMEGQGRAYDNTRMVELMCNGGTSKVELGECDLASSLGDVLRSKTGFDALNETVCNYSDAKDPAVKDHTFYQRLFYFCQPLRGGTLAAYAVCEREGAGLVFGGRLQNMADAGRELLPIDLRDMVPDKDKRARLADFMRLRHVEGGINPATHKDIAEYADAHWLPIPSFGKNPFLQTRDNDFLVDTLCEFIPAPLAVKSDLCEKKHHVMEAFNTLQRDTPRGDGVNGTAVGLMGAVCTQVFWRRRAVVETGLAAANSSVINFSTAENLERAMRETGYQRVLQSMKASIMQASGLL